MKIFDCFTFFNELPLLELRLMEYYDIVDYFVLVESTLSHTGKPKQLYFNENKEKYSKYLDKIVHVIVEDLPNYSSQNIWPPENFQRNCIDRGLKQAGARLGDIIIIEDADEFFDPRVLQDYINSKESGLVAIAQYLFYYWVNCLQNQVWYGSCIGRYGFFKEPQDLRNWSRFGIGSNADRFLPAYGGWHYSFMGGAEKIKEKVENIAESHLIIDQVGDVEEIQSKLDNVIDLWGRTEELAHKEIIDISPYHPKSMHNFLKLYPDFHHGNFQSV